MIVISNDDDNRQGLDVLVVAMTSNPKTVAYSFRISSADLDDGLLNRPGVVRADKIYTLAKSIVVRKSAKVSRQVVDRIRGEIASLTSPTA